MVYIVGQNKAKQDKQNQASFARLAPLARDLQLAQELARTKAQLARVNRAINVHSNLIGALVQTIDLLRATLVARFGDGLHPADQTMLSRGVEADVIRRANELAQETAEALAMERMETCPDCAPEGVVTAECERCGGRGEIPLDSAQAMAAKAKDSLVIRLVAGVGDGSAPQRAHPPKPAQSESDQ